MPRTDSNKSSFLKNAREAKGLTLEIVHEATKIPLDALKAIEEGYSVRILSPFYYRGFIKIYAEFLGLNVQETYQHYGIDTPAKVIPAASHVPLKSARQVTAAPEPNVVLEQIQEWASAVLKPQNLILATKTLGSLIVIILLFKMSGCVVSHLHQKTPTVKKTSAAALSKKKPEPVEDDNFDKPVPAVAEVKHETVQVQSENHKVEVAVRATRNTWLQVKADGKVVFQMTLSKGSLESWSADKEIELSGKNINQLDMEVNGKHIGSLGESGRKVKKVLITQEGLTVRK